MICIWFYFMLIFFFLVIFVFVFVFSLIFKKKKCSFSKIFKSKFFIPLLSKKFHCFSCSTIMHMHFSHMNIFLGWEIEMTLKILKIKCRDYNPSEFLSHSFFLEGYFLLISFFIWKHITLLLLSLIILWFGWMLRINQFYTKLE